MKILRLFPAPLDAQRAAYLRAAALSGARDARLALDVRNPASVDVDRIIIEARCKWYELIATQHGPTDLPATAAEASARYRATLNL